MILLIFSESLFSKKSPSDKLPSMQFLHVFKCRSQFFPGTHVSHPIVEWLSDALFTTNFHVAVVIGMNSSFFIFDF